MRFFGSYSFKEQTDAFLNSLPSTRPSSTYSSDKLENPQSILFNECGDKLAYKNTSNNNLKIIGTNDQSGQIEVDVGFTCQAWTKEIQNSTIKIYRAMKNSNYPNLFKSVYIKCVYKGCKDYQRAMDANVYPGDESSYTWAYPTKKISYTLGQKQESALNKLYTDCPGATTKLVWGDAVTSDGKNPDFTREENRALYGIDVQYDSSSKDYVLFIDTGDTSLAGKTLTLKVLVRSEQDATYKIQTRF